MSLAPAVPPPLPKPTPKPEPRPTHGPTCGCEACQAQLARLEADADLTRVWELCCELGVPMYGGEW